MSGRIIPLGLPRDPRHGIVHVMGNSAEGFEVAHESGSGSSWGNFQGPYADPQEAIAAAYILNRDEYSGQCAVSICDEAQPVGRGPAPLSRSEF
ncbi:hypothetical protein KZ813_17925 [Sphingomonas sp. RHCKR7]|uniref:hypothetical protein n=1 Tax=Sphingomonas folli TaxID=2862497 RepID=UPI001CA5945C|nr:hypothetical protein [Sphingomonas folli]MBW6528724.1 hypothetical protein [Sphingomonas folli]